MIEIWIEGEPETKFHFIAATMNRPPGAFIREQDTTGKNKGAKRRWQKHVISEVKAFILENRPRFFAEEEPTILEIWTYIPRPKSYPKKVRYHTKKKDTSNFAYFIENMLSGLLCNDDGQHVDLHWFKRLADENHAPGVFIRMSAKVGDPDHPLTSKGEKLALIPW